jgi:MHS family proline/betaine transporter-like MFS transporter
MLNCDWEESMSSRFKVALSSMAGNMLEFYDFYLYGTFASILAGLFFPSYDATAALIASLGTFAAGYLMRPIGAVVFGHLGDRLGRKRALTLSIFFMAIPTLVIGLLPTYHTIGIFAPIILFSCRLLQGVCAGGEYNGAAIFTIEHMKKDQDGFAGSLMSVSGGGGGLLATFLGALFMHPSMPSWSWRIPFIFGAFLGVVGYYIRKKIGESPAFKEEVSKKPLSVPLLKAFQQYPVSILCCVGGAAFSGALSSTFVVYMNIYLTKVVGLTLNHSLWFNSFGLLIFVASAPLAGFLSDRFGKPKIMTISAIALILFFLSRDLGVCVRFFWRNSCLASLQQDS